MDGDERITPQHRLNAVLNGGYWARMTLLERGVWLVLYGRHDFETGLVQVPMASIARLAGCSNLRRTRHAVQSIEMQGMLEKIPQAARGGRDHVAIHRLLCPPPLPGLPPTDLDLFAPLPSPATPRTPTGPVTGPVDKAVRGINGAGERRQQGRSATPNGAGARHPTGPVSGPPFTNSLNPPPHLSQHGKSTGPVNGPVGSSGETGGPGRGKEEVEFVEVLHGQRGVYRHHALQFVRQGLTRADADALWRDVVNDRDVKHRGKVYFRRLKDHLQPPPPAKETA